MYEDYASAHAMQEETDRLADEYHKICEPNPDDTDFYGMVNHPKHYTTGKYEVIDIIRDTLSHGNYSPIQGYYLGNIIKYIMRYKHKSGVQDLEKAKTYLEWLIEAERQGAK